MKRVLLALSLPLFLVGCDAGSRALPPWIIAITSDDLTPTVDNPFFALPVGASWSYETQTEDGLEVLRVEVLAETKQVWGTAATVVRDTLTLDDRLVEETRDWYAQDAEGNVWQLGEDACEYVDDVCVDTGAAWEAGVDGAMPGLAMPADPQAGDYYYQEYYASEDEARVELVD